MTDVGVANKPWALQNMLKENKEIPNQKTIADNIMSIPKMRDRVLLAILYLTTARVGEIVRNKYHEERKGLTPGRISIEEHSGEQFLLIKLRNQKSKKQDREWKEIPIRILSDIDGELAKVILLYTNNKPVDEPLFSLSTNYVWQLTQKYLQCNPHWLRHIRLSHLCHKHDYNEHDLMQVAGWTDTRPSSVYVSTKWENVADKELKL